MYTHARQFPHLAGKTDEQIRALVSQGMLKRPKYITVMRARNRALFAVMLGAVIGLVRMGNWRWGAALMLVGAVATFVVLLWNLVWVNVVVFKITKEDTSGLHN